MRDVVVPFLLLLAAGANAQTWDVGFNLAASPDSLDPAFERTESGLLGRPGSLEVRGTKGINLSLVKVGPLRSSFAPSVETQFLNLTDQGWKGSARLGFSDSIELLGPAAAPLVLRLQVIGSGASSGRRQHLPIRMGLSYDADTDGDSHADGTFAARSDPTVTIAGLTAPRVRSVTTFLGPDLDGDGFPDDSAAPYSFHSVIDYFPLDMPAGPHLVSASVTSLFGVDGRGDHAFRFSVLPEIVPQSGGTTIRSGSGYAYGPVPEPASMAGLALGLAAFRKRRRREK